MSRCQILVIALFLSVSHAWAQGCPSVSTCETPAGTLGFYPTPVGYTREFKTVSTAAACRALCIANTTGSTYYEYTVTESPLLASVPAALAPIVRAVVRETKDCHCYARCPQLLGNLNIDVSAIVSGIRGIAGAIIPNFPTAPLRATVVRGFLAACAPPP